MKRPYLIYGLYTGILAIFVISIMATPYLAFSDEEGTRWIYDVFSPTCHQKISRSLCVFQENRIADCTPQNGTIVVGDSKLIKVEENGILGYKIPVCSRDLGLYAAMLLGAIAYPFFRKIENGCAPPAIFLILAIVPMGIDGTLQLMSEIFPNVIGLYESTNAIRVITGVIAGFAASVYAIPIMVNLFGKPEDKRKICGLGLLMQQKKNATGKR